MYHGMIQYDMALEKYIYSIFINCTLSNIYVCFTSCKEARNEIAHKYVGYKELALGVFFLIKIDSILFLLFY